MVLVRPCRPGRRLEKGSTVEILYGATVIVSLGIVAGTMFAGVNACLAIPLLVWAGRGDSVVLEQNVDDALEERKLYHKLVIVSAAISMLAAWPAYKVGGTIGWAIFALSWLPYLYWYVQSYRTVRLVRRVYFINQRIR